LEEEEAEWKLSRKPVACGQYSHLEELVGHLEAGLDSSYCWIECLPLELLRKVFLHLSTDDLKAAVQVCRRWREAVGSCGKPWSSLHINSRNISPVSTLLGTGRLSRLKTIKVEKVTEQLLEAMVEHEGLEEINFSGSDLSSVDPTLLANLVERLESVNLRKTRLTRNQLEVLFNRLGEKRTGLKGLNIEKNDLSSVLPAQLAGALRGLEELLMSRGVIMTSEQQLILAVHSLGDDTPLNLYLDWCNAEGHPALLWCLNIVYKNPGTLLAVTDILRGGRLWSLESLVMYNLPFGSLSKELLEVLIQYASIKMLDVSYSSLVYVEPELLATLVTQAVEVNLSGTDLTKKQLKALLLRISQEETSLKKLDLSENILSSVEPSLLASSLTRLTMAGLSFCHLAPLQVEVLLASMTEDPHCLEDLRLSDNYLTQVDPVLIGQSLVGLKTANLCGTKLRLRQISAVLALIINSTTLESITIDLYQVQEQNEEQEYLNPVYQPYQPMPLNQQEYHDYKDLIQEAKNKMTVSEISKKQRKKEFFDNGPRLMKLLNDCNL